LGDEPVHHGVEINPSLVDLSRSNLKGLGFDHIEIFHHSCFLLDLAQSMRYARIYIGAGATVVITASILALLQVGGILVGPISWPDGSQQLIQARRTSEEAFAIRPILAVQFTPLISPPKRSAFFAAAACDTENAAPTRRGSASSHSQSMLALKAPQWCPKTHSRFPHAHRAAVRAVLMLNGRGNSLLAYLPKELWTEGILPHLDFDAYLPFQAASSPRGSWPRSLEAATLSLAALTSNGGTSTFHNADEPSEDDSDEGEPNEDESDEGEPSADDDSVDEMAEESGTGEYMTASELSPESTSAMGAATLAAFVHHGMGQPTASPHSETPSTTPGAIHSPVTLPTTNPSHEMLSRFLHLLSHAASMNTSPSDALPIGLDSGEPDSSLMESVTQPLPMSQP